MQRKTAGAPLSNERMSFTNSDIRAFQRTVRGYYKKNGRHTLPWRQTYSPYRILVSEIMLQQTQVERVIPKYKNFLKKFPTLSVLANAPLSAVLIEWQGLGYNRRAKMLQSAARAILTEHNGRFPKSKEELLALPGIGPYTASAIRVFAFNEPETLIETNVRSVFIHHFFPKKKKVSDASLFPLIVASVDVQNPREWYSALMDYGSHVKQTVGNASRRSAHHVRQKPFKGSNRELRGTIMRELSKRKRSMTYLETLGFDKKHLLSQLDSLRKEGMIQESPKNNFSLAS